MLKPCHVRLPFQIESKESQDSSLEGSGYKEAGRNETQFNDESQMYQTFQNNEEQATQRLPRRLFACGRW